MRCHELRYDVGRAVRVGVVALGLMALTVPSVMILSSPEAFARGGDKGGDKGGLGGGISGGIGGDLRGGLRVGPGNARVGRGLGTAARASAGAGVSSAAGGGGGASGGGGPGGGAAPGVGGPDPGSGTDGGTDGSSISAAFETLSGPQQARVMQRCKDVVARPALADPNQLVICRTLMTMAKP